LKYLLALAIPLFCLSCTTTHSVSMPSEFKEKLLGRIVVEDEHLSFLRLNHPEFDPEKLLREKCPKGKISEIQTFLFARDLLILKFYSLKVQAKCLKRITSRQRRCGEG